MSAKEWDRYFNWLCRQVSGSGFKKLLMQLHNKEFVWFVPNDDNRLEDGRNLRIEFGDRAPLIDHPCSVLEMMIGLSRRLSFLDDGEPREWFWLMIQNLGLHELSDNVTYDSETVEDILDALIWRTYSIDGEGGLFPLDNPEQDQTYVEIWYQANAWMIEKDL